MLRPLRRLALIGGIVVFLWIRTPQLQSQSCPGGGGGGGCDPAQEQACIDQGWEWTGSPDCQCNPPAQACDPAEELECQTRGDDWLWSGWPDCTCTYVGEDDPCASVTKTFDHEEHSSETTCELHPTTYTYTEVTCWYTTNFYVDIGTDGRACGDPYADDQVETCEWGASCGDC